MVAAAQNLCYPVLICLIKTPALTGCSECASPTTPYSLACRSSPSNLCYPDPGSSFAFVPVSYCSISFPNLPLSPQVHDEHYFIFLERHGFMVIWMMFCYYIFAYNCDCHRFHKLDREVPCMQVKHMV